MIPRRSRRLAGLPPWSPEEENYKDSGSVLKEISSTEFKYSPSNTSSKFGKLEVCYTASLFLFVALPVFLIL